MIGMYTSSKRVVRDGRLVAFAGEEMTMDEAVSRGLIVVTEPAKVEEFSGEKSPEGEESPGAEAGGAAKRKAAGKR